MLVGGDFNFPNISWQDDYANIKPSPTYGTDINQIFVDTINDHGLLVHLPKVTIYWTCYFVLTLVLYQILR